MRQQNLTRVRVKKKVYEYSQRTGIKTCPFSIRTIQRGSGGIVPHIVPNIVPIKQLLVRFYDDIDVGAIKDFLKNQCYRTIQSESKQ